VANMQVRAVSTIRVAKRKRFAMVARETANDARLSFRARGVLLWLLDKPDDWQTDAARIAQEGPEGREAIRTALNELAKFGYLHREKKHDQAGQWFTTWTVYETPQTGNQALENRRLENRPSDSWALKEQETDTDTAKSSQLVDNADPACITCKGKGIYYDGMAGFDKTCRCTFRDELEEKH